MFPHDINTLNSETLYQKDAPSPAQDLEDMQSVLFLLEEADAYRQNGKTNLALKKYMAVKKVFDDFEDDQFDFHGYNLRKFTINIYFKCVGFMPEFI